MRTLVTGALGRVGRATVGALVAAGHEVTGTDRREVDWDAQPAGAPPYVKADLTDAGDVYALVGGTISAAGAPGPFDAVVHAAAVPCPGRLPPHAVFANNLMATFNVVEACVRWGVRRLVHISSESVAGFVFAEKPYFPDYLPVDEQHPTRPQDPYGQAKLFGEQLCSAAVDRAGISCVSLRPAWVQDASSYARELGPLVGAAAPLPITGWAYVDVYDLADAITRAVECPIDGHAVMYVANPDTVGGRPLHESWRRAYPQARTVLRPVSRPDASTICSDRAEQVLGWRARRSWRDYLAC